MAVYHSRRSASQAYLAALVIILMLARSSLNAANRAFRRYAGIKGMGRSAHPRLVTDGAAFATDIKIQMLGSYPLLGADIANAVAVIIVAMPRNLTRLTAIVALSVTVGGIGMSLYLALKAAYVTVKITDVRIRM